MPPRALASSIASYAVQDVRCVLGRCAGERQVAADSDESGFGAPRMDDADKGG
jgi:hypothetical protein